MKPGDFYIEQSERKTQDIEVEIPNGTYMFIITKHAPNERFPNDCVDMQLEVDEGMFKGSRINTRFSMIKKDLTPNNIAKRIYSEICDAAIGKKPDEFYELLGKKLTLNYKSTATEKGVYHNVSVPYKSKKSAEARADAKIGAQLDSTLSTEQEGMAESDIPF
jgi:hypothetical protein